MPGGGLSFDGQRWIHCRARFFLPVRVLSRLFRRLFLESLKKAYSAGTLQFFATLEPLRDPSTFAALMARARNCEWVVYSKPPFAGPQQVLDYVGRYTHRVAISNNRLLGIEGGKVQFHWKDYRDGSQTKTMDLDAEEFMRRFLLHVLPEGFQRIRYYGLLGNRHRQQKLALSRRLLGMQASGTTARAKDYRQRYEELTGRSLVLCPQCRRGQMIPIKTLPPLLCRTPRPMDSS